MALKPTTITISVYPLSGSIPFDVTIEGTLKSDTTFLEGKTIRLIRNGVVIATKSTGYAGYAGYYKFVDRLTVAGTYVYQTEFLGDAVYAGCEAEW